MVAKYLEEHVRTDCVQKIFIVALNIKNTRNLFKIVQKWSFNICCIGRKILKQKRL